MEKMLFKLRNKLNFHPRQIIHNLRTKTWNQNECSKYWENNNQEQPSWKYMNDSNWLQIKEALIYALVLIRKPKDNIKILEIGCNIGNNLTHLKQMGYNNLTGIEINKQIVNIIPKYITVKNIDITKLDYTLSYDVTFTSGVLMHIKDISFLNKIFTPYFVTFESESHKIGFIHKRNYKNVFSKLGYNQLGNKQFSFNSAYNTRLFKKI